MRASRHHALKPEDVERKIIMNDMKKKTKNSTERPTSILAVVTREVRPEVRDVLPFLTGMYKVVERATKDANYPHTMPHPLED